MFKQSPAAPALDYLPAPCAPNPLVVHKERSTSSSTAPGGRTSVQGADQGGPRSPEGQPRPGNHPQSTRTMLPADADAVAGVRPRRPGPRRCGQGRRPKRHHLARRPPLDVIAADAPRAYGRRSPLFVCDELTQWPAANRELYPAAGVEGGSPLRATGATFGAAASTLAASRRSWSPRSPVPSPQRSGRPHHPP